MQSFKYTFNVLCIAVFYYRVINIDNPIQSFNYTIGTQLFSFTHYSNFSLPAQQFEENLTQRVS